MIILAFIAGIVLVVFGHEAYKAGRAINWHYFDRPQNNVVEVRDFSCPGMSGFIFKYPVFRDWDVEISMVISEKGPSSKENLPDICSMLFKSAKYKKEQEILVTKGQPTNPDAHFFTSTFPFSNPNQIGYGKVENGVNFWVSNSEIKIRLAGVADNTFDKDLFFKTVIESFRPTDSESTTVAPYGKPIDYKVNKRITFSDFSVEYLPPAPGFDVPYQFAVKTANEHKIVSISKRLAENNLASFSVGGKTYSIQLILRSGPPHQLIINN